LIKEKARLQVHAIKKNIPETILKMVVVLASVNETLKEKSSVSATKMKLPKLKSNLFSVS
jgi:hypothetical protein